MRRVWLTVALSCAVLGGGSAAHAQETKPPAESADEVEAVVVTARRIGVPVWRVGTGPSAIIFVGSIGRIPKEVTWRQNELEAAVAGSRKVLYGVDFTITAGDLYRVLFKRGRWTDLPKGETLATLIGPELNARLAAYAAAGELDRDYAQLRPWYIANKLRSQARREAVGGVSASRVAGRAAGQAKVPVEALFKRRFNDVITRAPEERPSDVACLRAVADAADAGPAALHARAQAWTRSRVVEVLASPWTQAEGLCWPEGESGLGPELRTAWRAAVKRELGEPGAVVAIVPMRYLAESGGLLDDLQAQGYTVEGPRWRADQATPTD